MNLLTNMMMLKAAKGNDSTQVFEKIGKFANSMAGNITKVAWTVFILAIVIAGICWVVGGQTAQFAKSTMGRVIIGIALVALATAVVTTLASLFGGNANNRFGKPKSGMIDPAFSSYVKTRLMTLIN